MAFDLESVSEATSGAIGALVSTTVLYPLDTCKTKYQAEIRTGHHQKYRNISDVLWEAISTKQVVSLYQGLGTKNLQSFISSFIYFYGYSFFKRLYLKRSGNKTIGTKANLIIAAAAGTFNVIVTMPLDTASSKMQTSEFGKSKGLWRTLSEGTLGEAFDGLGISLLLTINPSIQYTVFDQLNLRMLKRKQTSRGNGNNTSSRVALSAFSAFVLGAVSKCVATCLTYPAIRCKVAIQAAESERRRDKESRKEVSKNSVGGALLNMGKRRLARLLQRAAGSDSEDCTELGPAFNGQGEDHQDYVGLDARPQKVRTHQSYKVEECLDRAGGSVDRRLVNGPSKPKWVPGLWRRSTVDVREYNLKRFELFELIVGS